LPLNSDALQGTKDAAARYGRANARGHGCGNGGGTIPPDTEHIHGAMGLGHRSPHVAHEEFSRTTQSSWTGEVSTMTIPSPLRPSHVDTLRSTFAGELTLPGDPNYDAARKVWNG